MSKRDMRAKKLLLAVLLAMSMQSYYAAPTWAAEAGQLAGQTETVDGKGQSDGTTTPAGNEAENVKKADTKQEVDESLTIMGYSVNTLNADDEYGIMPTLVGGYTGSYNAGTGSNYTVDYATAVGYNAVVNHLNSTALGYNTSTSAANQVSFGHWDGSTWTDRRSLAGIKDIDMAGALNAGGVSFIGNSETGSVFVGLPTRDDDGTTIEYYKSDVKYTTTFGYEASATGQASTALGLGAKAAGNSSVSIGGSSEANTEYSTAIGYDAHVNHRRSVAIGAFSSTNNDGQVSFGSWDAYNEEWVSNYNLVGIDNLEMLGELKVGYEDDNMTIIGEGKVQSVSLTDGTAILSNGGLTNLKNINGVTVAGTSASTGLTFGGNAIIGKTDMPFSSTGFSVSNTGAITAASINGAYFSAATDQSHLLIGSDERTSTNKKNTGIGISSIADGDSTVAVGYEAIAAEGRSIAIGAYSKAYAADSIVIGEGSEITNTGLGSIALGRGTKVVSQNSIAIGNRANISDESQVYSVAIGADSTTSKAKQVSFGHKKDDLDAGGSSFGDDLFRSVVNVADIEMHGGITGLTSIEGVAVSGSAATGLTISGITLNNGGIMGKVTEDNYKMKINGLDLYTGINEEWDKGSMAFGKDSVIGNITGSTTFNAIAIGTGADAESDNAIALGAHSLAYTEDDMVGNAMAIGAYAGAYSSNSVAFGYQAYVARFDNSGDNNLINNSMALGTYSSVNTSDTVSFGHKVGDGYGDAYPSKTYTDNLFRSLVNVKDIELNTADDGTGGAITGLTKVNDVHFVIDKDNENVAISDEEPWSTSSVIIGIGAVATTNGTAIGNQAEALNVDSTAVGMTAKASGEVSVAVGVGAEAVGDTAIAIGGGANAGHSESVAIGYDSTTSAANQVAFGKMTDPATFRSLAGIKDITLTGAVNGVTLGVKGGTADDKDNVLVGGVDVTKMQTDVAGKADKATVDTLSNKVGTAESDIGNLKTNTAGISVADNMTVIANGFKVGTTAYGMSSTGVLTAASGTIGGITLSGGVLTDVTKINKANFTADNFNIAVGGGATATSTGDYQGQQGYNSAFGTAATATGIYSSAIGAEAEATGKGSSAFGYTARATGERSSAIGAGATATGDYSSAFGNGAVTAGEEGSAFGSGAHADALFSSALGAYTQASGINSSAVGDSAKAIAVNSSAIGAYANATGKNSVAIGAGSAVAQDNEVNMGYYKINETTGEMNNPKGTYYGRSLAGISDLTVLADDTEDNKNNRTTIAGSKVTVGGDTANQTVIENGSIKAASINGVTLEMDASSHYKVGGVDVTQMQTDVAGKADKSTVDTLTANTAGISVADDMTVIAKGFKVGATTYGMSSTGVLTAATVNGAAITSDSFNGVSIKSDGTVDGVDVSALKATVDGISTDGVGTADTAGIKRDTTGTATTKIEDNTSITTDGLTTNKVTVGNAILENGKLTVGAVTLTGGKLSGLTAGDITSAASTEAVTGGQVYTIKSDLETSISGKADTTTVTALDTRVGTAETNIGNLQTATADMATKTQVATDISTAKTELETAYNAADTALSDRATVLETATTGMTYASGITTFAGGVAAANLAVGSNFSVTADGALTAKTINNVKIEKDGTAVKVGDIDLTALAGNSSGNAGDITALTGRVDTAEGKVSTLEATVGDSSTGLVKRTDVLETATTGMTYASGTTTFAGIVTAGELKVGATGFGFGSDGALTAKTVNGVTISGTDAAKDAAIGGYSLKTITGDIADLKTNGGATSANTVGIKHSGTVDTADSLTTIEGNTKISGSGIVVTGTVEATTLKEGGTELAAKYAGISEAYTAEKAALKADKTDVDTLKTTVGDADTGLAAVNTKVTDLQTATTGMSYDSGTTSFEGSLLIGKNKTTQTQITDNAIIFGQGAEKQVTVDASGIHVGAKAMNGISTFADSSGTHIDHTSLVTGTVTAANLNVNGAAISGNATDGLSVGGVNIKDLQDRVTTIENSGTGGGTGSGTSTDTEGIKRTKDNGEDVTTIESATSFTADGMQTAKLTAATAAVGGVDFAANGVMTNVGSINGTVFSSDGKIGGVSLSGGKVNGAEINGANFNGVDVKALKNKVDSLGTGGGTGGDTGSGDGNTSGITKPDGDTTTIEGNTTVTGDGIETNKVTASDQIIVADGKDNQTVISEDGIKVAEGKTNEVTINDKGIHVGKNSSVMNDTEGFITDKGLYIGVNSSNDISTAKFSVDKGNGTMTSKVGGYTFTNGSSGAVFSHSGDTAVTPGGSFTETTIKGNKVTTGRLDADELYVDGNKVNIAGGTIGQTDAVANHLEGTDGDGNKVTNDFKTSALNGTTQAAEQTSADGKKIIKTENNTSAGGTSVTTSKISTNSADRKTEQSSSFVTNEGGMSLNTSTKVTDKDGNVTKNTSGETKMSGDSLTVSKTTVTSKDGKEETTTSSTTVGSGEVTLHREDGSTIRVGEAIEGMQGQIQDIGSKVNEMGVEIKEVGALSAALAGLHPQPENANSRADFAMAMGSYEGKQALAVGGFYRPDKRTMLSIGASTTSSKHMMNMGISIALDKLPEAERKEQESNADLAERMKKLEADYEARLEKMEAAYEARMERLEARYARMKDAYEADKEQQKQQEVADETQENAEAASA